MSSEKAVLLASRVSKCYEIYRKPIHRLYQTLCMGHRKFYREFWALREISLEVARGECVGILGRNGAGKSTLLQIIAGTLQPTSGEVKRSGRIGALLELGSGFNPEFTGRENVFLNGTIIGLKRRTILEKYDEIIDFADIGDFIDQPVKTYSSGMRMRLAFAVQIVTAPDILIIDEALSVGDTAFQQKCMRFLRRFMEDHTVLFVSHNIASVKSLCSRAIYLKKGRLDASGDPKDIAELYLKDLYADNQRIDGTQTAAAVRPVPGGVSRWRDMRCDFLNRTNLRNDLEVFTFREDAKSFGAGGIKIKNVCFTDEKNRPVNWIVGGEIVKLHVECLARQDIFSPIVGFYVNDKLGQKLFGDNTCLTYLDHPLTVSAGEMFSADFTFVMPLLPKGHYSVLLSAAEGTQKENIQHEWMYEALLFESHASSIAVGLAGIPMHEIKMARMNPEEFGVSHAGDS